MHAFSLWRKVLAGSRRSQAKAKTHSKTKTSQAKPPKDSSTTAPQGRHGPRRVSADARGASGDGFVGGFLGVRRLKIMTSRSRVCGNKYKVNNQNLDKFDQILSKIPEGEKTKPATSSASLPEKREDVCRTPVQPQERLEERLGESLGERLGERLGPDISPSATMGSSVTAEYELFCKEFHSEAKQLLTDEEPEKTPVNPMRQLLQQASEAAAKGLTLQRVTTAAGTPPSASHIGTRTLDTERHSAMRPPGFVASMAASETNSVCPPTPLPDGAEGEYDPELVDQLVVALQGEENHEKSEMETMQQDNQLDTKEQQPQAPQEDHPQQSQKPRSSRRWSENPVNTPIFMAKKFAEKLLRTKDGATPPASETTQSTSPAMPGSSSNQAPPSTTHSRKSSTSSKRRSQKHAAPPPYSKQPSATGQTTVVQEQATSRESTHTSTSSKKRGKHKRKSRSPKEPED
ncbi:uncharacterized protein LOC119179732 [Rhipicephalus microplus]|uniref:uncharacterized protein LOC119179732 n=1 Tax=Rhipicephalus microplus TaxID=6941 RepID=UPI003F6A694A